MPETEIIALSSATIGIAVAGSVWAARARYLARASRYLIAVFMLLASLAALPLAAAFSEAVYLAFVPAMLPVLLAIPPAVYRFVVNHSQFDQLTQLHWRDFALPGLAAIVTLGYWLLPYPALRVMLVEGELPAGALPAALALLTFALIFCWVAVSFAYLFGTARHLCSFRRRLKDLYSNTYSRELRWIDWFMGFLFLVWSVAAVSLIAENSPLGVTIGGEVILALLALLLLFLIAFVSSGDVPEGQKSADAAMPDSGGDSPKYSRSALSKDLAERLSGRIEAAMSDDQLYLDPNLSLQKLSRHVGALPNQVSQVLNEEIGATFFDYVARWRVNAARPLIVASQASVLSISLDVGFNSRSTFYKAFKRETGMTPKAFRDHGKEASPQG
uniref:helix-turn-helix domain-containing protein n=1 Tax=uncultured Erythrobacter sp. TaxID=263913 RepID=UPI00260B0BE5|nr:helix-turn-helix transcriptional regulator [uncultured Erythrobacter sp.]